MGLVRASVALKEQREEAERRAAAAEKDRLERELEKEREAARDFLVRTERGRVKRLELLLSAWRRNRDLTQLVNEVNAAVGTVDVDSELGRWLSWAADYVVASHPLRRFLECGSTVLTLYYRGHDHAEIAVGGSFTEPQPTQWDTKPKQPGIELTDRPLSRLTYDRGLGLTLPEALVLPYELMTDDTASGRSFRVAVAVLNQALRSEQARVIPGP